MSDNNVKLQKANTRLEPIEDMSRCLPNLQQSMSDFSSYIIVTFVIVNIYIIIHQIGQEEKW